MIFCRFWIWSILAAVILEEITPLHLQGNKEPLGNQNAPFQHVEQLIFAPSGKDFYEKYVRLSKPVLLRNAIKKWPAYDNWKNLQYLKKVYGNETFNVEFRKKFENVFPLRKTWKLSQFLDEYQDKSIYMDSIFSPGSLMTKDVLLPPLLHCNKIRSGVDNLNILMSSGNTSSALHQDGYENLLSVITGVKDVILYDSKYTRLLEADNFTLAPGVSQIDPESVDIERYKQLAEIPYLVATINAGDMLYIPQYWWHQVRSYNNPNIAVGIWFSVFNFNQEFDQRKIDETADVIKATETFRELIEKEPLAINCEDTEDISRTSLYSSAKATELEEGNAIYQRHGHTCMY